MCDREGMWALVGQFRKKKRLYTFSSNVIVKWDSSERSRVRKWCLGVLGH